MTTAFSLLSFLLLSLRCDIARSFSTGTGRYGVKVVMYVMFVYLFFYSAHFLTVPKTGRDVPGENELAHREGELFLILNLPGFFVQRVNLLTCFIREFL